MSHRYKSISKRGRSLLSREEGTDVDFKKTDKFDSEDLVAFANSLHGGAILLGVDELTDSKTGRQVAHICGCRLTDQLRLKIDDRASSCTPPLSVSIFEENGAHTPFIRIEIPPGDNAPYCTGAGTYKIRSDGRNRPIQPHALLDLFLAREAEQFVERFRHAAEALRSTVNDLRGALATELGTLCDDVREIRTDIESAVRDIASESVDANMHAEDASASCEAILRLCEENQVTLNEAMFRLKVATSKLDSLLVAGGVPDKSVSLIKHEIELAVYLATTQSQSNSQIIAALKERFPTATPGLIKEIVEAQQARDASLRRKHSKR